MLFNHLNHGKNTQDRKTDVGLHEVKGEWVEIDSISYGRKVEVIKNENGKSLTVEVSTEFVLMRREVSQVSRTRIDHAEIVGGYELSGRTPTNKFIDVTTAQLGYEYAVFQKVGSFSFPEPTVNLGRWPW